MNDEEYVTTKEMISAIIFDFDYDDPEERPHEETCNELAAKILNELVIELQLLRGVDLTQKWIMAYDTMCDGQQCFCTDPENTIPELYDSEEAINKEIAADKRFFGGCYPVRADEYVHGRKAIFTGGKEGGHITGQKLNKYGRISDGD